MKLPKFGLAFVLFASLPALSPAQCPPPADPQFTPFHNKVDKPAEHFEWYSAAARNPTQGGGHPSHVFDRHVENLGNTTLKYNWPVGRMHNDALPAGSTDPFCYEYGWPNQKDGPLNYGRGNDLTDTTVWEGKDEPKASSIAASFSFSVLDGDHTRTISLRVSSSVRQAGIAFSYAYYFISKAGQVVTLYWDVEKDQILFENLKKNQISKVFQVEGKREIIFDSPAVPTVDFRTVNIVINGKQVAGVEMPMLLPGKSL